MKKVWKNWSRDVLIAMISLVFVAMIVCCVIMLTGYTDELHEQAGTKALLFITDTSGYLDDSLNTYLYKTGLAAEKLNTLETENFFEFSQALRDLTLEERFSNVCFSRFFKDGVEFDTTTNVEYPTSDESSTVVRLSNRGEIGFAGILTDRKYNITVAAFCAPIKDCEFADSIVLYYPVGDVVTLAGNQKTDYTESARTVLLCAADGEVVNVVGDSDDFGVQLHDNVYQFLAREINDKSVTDNLRDTILKNELATYPVLIENETHILSVGSAGGKDAPIFLIGIYRAIDLYNAEYSTVSTILGALIIFVVLMIFFVIYFFVSRRRTARMLLTIGDIDSDLDCPTQKHFERESATLISRNRGSIFSIVVIEMNHYDYIREHYGDEFTKRILLYLKLIITNSLKLDETYGYMGSGRFVLLLHDRDRDALKDRIQILCGLAHNYRADMPQGYHIELVGGIYEERQNVTNDVGKMIDLALEAKNALNMETDFGSFRFFSEHLKERRSLNEYIEMNMNSALENKHFRVFYQPKYNIPNDRPDSCEALVRWYNPEWDEYMRPGEFMPLFEANGFIVKLDKYVYEQVCTYIEESVLHGEVLYPVSVNVSRITALQKDFLDYYISVKKKHNIADRFITLEFTESAAYENYEGLRDTVNALHQNGFKCSIDDFGTGYSSYNILKEIPMDEIKLDRFFMLQGLSGERDMKILESVIKIARELNMKVVQEGVETPEQLELLRRLGCHVIQGYYYSKPLAQSDYVTFITEHFKNSDFVNRH